MSTASLIKAGEIVPLDEIDLSRYMVSVGKLAPRDEEPNPTLPDAAPTVYYVNFTPEVAEAVRPQLIILQQNILDFRSWATLQTNLLVRKKIDDGSIDSNDKVGIGSYRAKVMESYYRERTTWLASAIDVNNTETLTIRSTEFHINILRLALKGFPIPMQIMGVLEEVLQAIVQSISGTTAKDHTKGMQYWIQTTVYIYDPMSQTLQPKIRTINFMTTSETYEVTTSKSTTKHTTMTVSFSGQESDWNNRVWEGVRQSIEDEAIRKGEELSKEDGDWDVPI